jgi:hypothetical protein
MAIEELESLGYTYISGVDLGNQKFDFDLLEHDPDELAAFEKYSIANLSNVT